MPTWVLFVERIWKRGYYDINVSKEDIINACVALRETFPLVSGMDSGKKS